MPIPSNIVNEFIVNDKDVYTVENNDLPDDYNFTMEFTINDLSPSSVEHIYDLLNEYQGLTVNDLPPAYFELVFYLETPVDSEAGSIEDCEEEEYSNNNILTVNDLPTDLSPNTINYLTNVLHDIPVTSLEELADSIIDYVFCQ